MIIYNNTQKWALEKNSILKKLTRIQVEKIIANTKRVNYEEKDVVFECAKPITRLVIVLDGSLMEE